MPDPTKRPTIVLRIVTGMPDTAKIKRDSADHAFAKGVSDYYVRHPEEQLGGPSKALPDAWQSMRAEYGRKERESGEQLAAAREMARQAESPIATRPDATAAPRVGKPGSGAAIRGALSQLFGGR